jgi:surface polysaccharide O-acyltransferase-like enzyme
MVMILFLHADFLATGAPSRADFAASPVESFGKNLIEALTIIAVNAFVLLSGWFGLRPKLSRFFELVFQVVFINVLCVVTLEFMGEDISVDDAIRDIFMVDNAQWFVKTYLLLYLISPVLNKFVEHATKKEYKILLITYLCFQSIYGWYFKTVEELIYGYSLSSFIIIYLIGRYLRIHAEEWRNRLSRAICWGGYFLLSLMISGIASSRLHIEGDAYSYTSPLVLLSSVAFVLAFSKMKFSSRSINWIAQSCLAVYLLHMNKFVAPHFLKILSDMYKDYGFVHYWGLVAGISLGIFFVAVIVDKARIIVWNALWKRIERKWLISQ